MNSFFEPDPLVLGFFFVQNLLWFPAIAVIALLRVVVARGASRWCALAALLLCAFGIASAFAPALGLADALAPVTRALAAMGSPGRLIPSVLIALSAIVPTSRWRWLDVLHGVCVIGFVGVWIWIS